MNSKGVRGQSARLGRQGRQGLHKTGLEEFALTIEAVAYGGSGVGRENGRVVFVPFAIPGERVRVRVVKARKRYCEAELLEVLEPSKDRIPPPCPVFGNCGGCAYQHVSYRLQLEWKQSQVRDLLERVGRISGAVVEATVGSRHELYYRNRVRVHVRGGRVGFFGRQTASLVEVKECLIAEKNVNQRLVELRRSRPVDGDYTLSSRSGVRFFEQTSDNGAEELARVTQGHLGEERGLLVDAYCGAGFFAKRLVSTFARVVGIESHPAAVEVARKTAGPSEHYVCGDVAEHLGKVLEGVSPEETCVLMDPPASGLAPQVLEFLRSFRPGRIVYVSCDPATLARDVGQLARSGFVLERVTPVDMFPQTADIEVVASLRPAPHERRLPGA